MVFIGMVFWIGGNINVEVIVVSFVDIMNEVDGLMEFFFFVIVGFWFVVIMVFGFFWWVVFEGEDIVNI